jgi:ubiquinone/menaquinone biosynthesis C-methylase UbiE
MQHADHVNLIRKGVEAPGVAHPGGVWADFGSGSGAFTLALAELVGPSGVIYSIDRQRGSLDRQTAAMRSSFPAVRVHYLAADFTQTLDLPALDGALMANSLHFIRDKEPLVRKIKAYLHPGGKLLVVEYNVSRGNFAVPHPLTYPEWETLARRCGFENVQLLATRPSSFLKEFYSAAAW